MKNGVGEGGGIKDVSYEYVKYKVKNQSHFRLCWSAKANKRFLSELLQHKEAYLFVQITNMSI